MAFGEAALLSQLCELGGAGVAVTELPASEIPETPGLGVVRVGVHRGGARPTSGLEPFDVLLSSDPDAPRPWVGLAPHDLDARLEELKATIAHQPVAAAVAAQVLRMTLRLDFDQALVLEGMAYSMLLASAGFARWRRDNPVCVRRDETGARVSLVEDGERLLVRLDRPAARNAFDARMRDELTEALAFALDDPLQRSVELQGLGPAFSAGGDLDEFGTAADPGLAHLIRVLRSPVGLLHRLAGRGTARVHGACIGAGVEVAAAAHRVTARPGAFFRLPEVAMGLIPGAGGTASVPRRIGRRRACYMALSGRDIDLATALDWGLVDAVESPFI